MKRAVVWKGNVTSLWYADITNGFTVMRCRRFRTYSLALAHALAAVGLTPTNPEKEQNR